MKTGTCFMVGELEMIMMKITWRMHLSERGLVGLVLTL